MENLQIQIKISPELYLKNPDPSELGRNIVSSSIELINELGFEAFTFKKLGEKIGSPESSIYRYFESKHTLLVYLACWYWSWMEYKLVFKTINVDSPRHKLKEAVKMLTQPITVDKSFSYIDEGLLDKIIITESVKAYHTKNVDSENERGYFKAYKQVVKRVSDIILEINPKFEFPRMLISTIIEGAHHQRYFAEHLPSLTDVNHKKDSVSDFYTQMVFKVIEE
ncbi:TetR/AcrR family transcriptional regulator [Bacteroidota bacterium]